MRFSDPQDVVEIGIFPRVGSKFFSRGIMQAWICVGYAILRSNLVSVDC